MPDFIPPGGDARKTWCTAFASKIASHGAALNLAPGEVTTAQAKCAAITARIDEKASKKNEWQSSIAAAQTGNAADFTELRATIAAIKTNSAYTEAMGEDLGFIGPADAFDPNTYQAELRDLSLTGPHQVTVKFGKANGNIDGVNVCSRLQGTSEWKFLSRDTQPPYVDTTPLATASAPEVREYRIRAVIDDVEIGEYSPTRQITVT